MSHGRDADPALLAVYQAEVLELLDSLGATFEQLRAEESAGRAELLRAAMRIAHTIKGSSRITGFDTIVELAHAMEDTLKSFDEIAAAEQLERITLLFEAIRVTGDVVEGKCGADEASAMAARLKSRFSEPANESARKAPPSLGPGPPGVNSSITGENSSELEKQSRAQAEAPPLGSKWARVDLRRLDHLMNAVHELVLSHQMVGSIDREFLFAAESLFAQAKIADPADHKPDLEASARLLERRRSAAEPLFSLSEQVLSAAQKLRMVPLHSLLPQWKRTVGEAAHALSKRIELHSDIGELELDRHVLECLKDPIMHLIRNAVDHGIESSSERIQRGKQPTAIVQIRARIAGTTATIDVSDDGRGLDIDRIRAQAVRQGLLEPEQAASMQANELSSCLFHPGFSTAQRVSTLSGRGMGLDVVREAVRELGGRVEVKHPPALGGATFSIEVPVDIALVRGLLVSSGNVKFVLPVEHIRRVLRVPAEQLHWIGNTCYANDELGQPLTIQPLWPSLPIPNAKGRLLTVVWMTHGRKPLGLWVDELFEEHFFLTHAPPWNLRRVSGIGAFVVLDDGRPAAVIDVSTLFDRTTLKPSHEPIHIREIPRILVVDDSLSVRTLVRTTLQSAGYEVIAKADGREAWQALSESSFSLVVSDVRMPQMDGLELVRRIRSSETLKNLPVILLTSLDKPEDISAGAKSGANEYIVKGRFDQSRLLEAVARFV